MSYIGQKEIVMENATRVCRQFLFSHPHIRDCLQQGLMNYSSLARLICDKHPTLSFDAVQMACRRFYRRHKKEGGEDKDIVSLVKRAKVTIHTKICVATVRRTSRGSDFERIQRLQEEIQDGDGDVNVVFGQDTLTLIAAEQHAPSIRRLFRSRILRFSDNLVQIFLVTNKSIETTPGVVAHVYGSLQQRGVNILEEMSCWTDIMFIIASKDLPKALGALEVNS